MTKRQQNADLAIEAVAMMFKAARSKRDLADAMDIKFATAAGYIERMHGEGLVHIREWRWPPGKGKVAAIYAWQPTIGELPDAPKPRTKYIMVPTTGGGV